LVAALSAIVPNTSHSVDLNHLEGPPPTFILVHFGSRPAYHQIQNFVTDS
jgi:hypothetical protein